MWGGFLQPRSSYQTVGWEGHPLRRCEARGDHVPLVLPYGARKRVELDRGLVALRLWRARYAHIRLERPEAVEEHRDQERGAWGCQCGVVVERRVEGGQVGGDWGGRRHQGVASEIPRVVGGPVARSLQRSDGEAQ